MSTEFTPDELASEEWRDVVGFEGAYGVSSLGRVRKMVSKSGKTLAPPLVLQAWLVAGYWHVGLWRNGVRSHHSVHRLVARAFHGECPNGLECAHENGVRSDCRAANLKWKTKGENGQDRIRHGTQSHGHTSPRTSLCEGTVQVMRWLAIEHGNSISDVARWFGISRQSASKIVSGQRWSRSGVLRRAA